MIKNIFLDLDDTILDFRRGERIALCRTFELKKIKYDEDVIKRYVEINLDCWRALERGEMTRDEVLVGRFNRLFCELGIKESAVEVQKIYENSLAQEREFLPGGKELLDSLGKCGKYRLFMATNGIPEVQKPRIKNSGVGEYFDGIFISDEIGFSKPDRRFFEKCFDLIPNFKKEETIIVGDSLSSDIQGGINAGILTCHFNPKASSYSNIKPDYTINELSELIPLLDGIK